MRIAVLIKEILESSLTLPPREGAIRRWPYMNQEEGSHQKPNLLGLDLGLPRFQKCEE